MSYHVMPCHSISYHAISGNVVVCYPLMKMILLGPDRRLARREVGRVLAWHPEVCQKASALSFKNHTAEISTESFLSDIQGLSFWGVPLLSSGSRAVRQQGSQAARQPGSQAARQPVSHAGNGRLHRGRRGCRPQSPGTAGLARPMRGSLSRSLKKK